MSVSTESSRALFVLGPGSPSLTVTEAARILGVTPQFLRMGLQQGRFPFGAAVKMKRWAYYINADKFYNYLTENMLVISKGR